MLLRSVCLRQQTTSDEDLSLSKARRGVPRGTQNLSLFPQDPEWLPHNRGTMVRESKIPEVSGICCLNQYHCRHW